MPLPDVKKNPEQLRLLENWMRAQKPEELFDANGTLIPELKALAPTGTRRMSANPHANGGHPQETPCGCPISATTRWQVEQPGKTEAENTRPLGDFLRDVMKRNMDNFRVFGPDETTSNKLDAIYEASKKFWIEEYFPEDADGGELAPDGRVMEMLSEHTWRACSKAICSPAATASSPPTRRSCTSSTRCSTSTPSGCRSATTFPGGRTSHR